MPSLHASLIREKFELRPLETLNGQTDNEPPVVAASNRISLNFKRSENKEPLKYVVRTHTMQSCLRMARLIIARSPICGVDKLESPSIPFEELWNKVLEQSYDKEVNADSWCVIYREGRPVFHEGNYHIFLDLIEKYADKNKSTYDQSPKLVQSAFKEAGKTVDIIHDSQIAAIIDVSEERSKCGIIMRSPMHTRTCNVTVSPHSSGSEHVLTALKLAADYLEGFHLSFIIGNKESQILLKKDHHVTTAKKRIKDLWDKIHQIENNAKDIENIVQIGYRPERPSFKSIVKDTIEAGKEKE